MYVNEIKKKVNFFSFMDAVKALSALTFGMDCNLTAMGTSPVMSTIFLIA
jgi:hypothetical protein